MSWGHIKYFIYMITLPIYGVSTLLFLFLTQLDLYINIYNTEIQRCTIYYKTILTWII